MTHRRAPVRYLVLCACLLAIGAGSAEAGFVVVKNARNTTARLTRDAVKGLFSGRTKAWASGDNVVLVIGNEDSPAMQWLADAIFGVSAKTLLAKIKQDVFKGDVARPLSANDDAATVKRILSGPGVIGLVSDAAAKSLPSELAVIPVDR